MTPEERAAIELRIADLTARMAKLDHLRHLENIPDWGALYDEREELDKQFGDEV